MYSLAGVPDLYAYNRGYLNMTPASDTAKLRAVADTAGFGHAYAAREHGTDF